MNQCSRKVARAWIIATSATSLGAASHLLGGGHLPHPIVLALATALAALITLGITQLKLPRTSLGAGVLVGQGILHLLYSYGHPVSHLATHTGGHQHGETTVALTAVALDGHSYGAGMWLAHSLAAGATYALLAYSEELLGVLKTLLGYARRFFETPKLPALTLAPTIREATGHLLVLKEILAVGTRTSRGPPPALAYR